MQVGRDKFGRAALGEWFDGVLRTFGVSIHFIGNHRITIEDEAHASGAVYYRAEHEVGDSWIEMMVLYWDTYECVDGSWLFRRRREQVWYGAEAAGSPAGPRKDRRPGRDPRPAACHA